MAFDLAGLESRLWAAADELRANSTLKASEYSVPVLGLIFLRYAEVQFRRIEAELVELPHSSRRSVGPVDYKARGAIYLPAAAQFANIVALPESADLGMALNEAMLNIEEANEDLRGVLPRSYNSLERRTLVELLRLVNSIPGDVPGDAFGLLYEYFLGKFAMSEGQKGGEFFTPVSIVRLIVEIIEPFHGRIYDPACGSGGMFVQSARFVESHARRAADELSVFGQERVAETVRLAKMNLAVHGLAGDIREANSYYDDLHDATGSFDFVMANPPFNVNRVDRQRLRDDKSRFPFGMPTSDNANYLWIQLFRSALNESGRAGFVMANGAADARGSEQSIRRDLIADGSIDAVVSVGPNFFYTVTLPVTLWFLDRAKRNQPREDNVLFVDARSIYRQVDKAHREFAPEQIEFIANIVRLYRGEIPETTNESAALMESTFPDAKYCDVSGLCRVVDRHEIAAQDWSLSPARYVRDADGADSTIDATQRTLEAIAEDFEVLMSEARELESSVQTVIASALDQPS
jgi:type I restriction enzyme M protein